MGMAKRKIFLPMLPSERSLITGSKINKTEAKGRYFISGIIHEEQTNVQVPGIAPGNGRASVPDYVIDHFLFYSGKNLV
jgi:hypothetical protein